MSRFVIYAERNKLPISCVLDRFLTGLKGSLLEVAGGTGQHAEYFAQRYPSVEWTSTDLNDISSIQERTCSVDNVRSQTLDASQPSTWGNLHGLDAMYVCNLTHISPFTCTQGIFEGARDRLQPWGKVFIYGPFSKDGVITPESNASFNASLRQQNPLWGYRDIESEIVPLASSMGFELELCEPMPANNFMLVFKNRNYGDEHPWPVEIGERTEIIASNL